jgi:hypothetical protein
MYGEIVWAPFSVGQQLFDENQKFGYARLMNNSALAHRLDRRVPVPAARRERSAEKNSGPVYPM